MKKLIILGVAICAAVAAQAAAFAWKTGTGQNVYLMNTTDRAASVTAYIFSTDVAYADVISAFTAGTFAGTGSLDSSTTSSVGAVAAKNTAPFSWGEAGDTLTSYFALVTTVEGKDYLYISPEASATGTVSGNATITFSAKASSQAAAMDASAGYQGAGWYTAVPEPTSGLLMLLGMAGLALRRRRA